MENGASARWLHKTEGPAQLAWKLIVLLLFKIIAEDLMENPEQIKFISCIYALFIEIFGVLPHLKILFFFCKEIPQNNIGMSYLKFNHSNQK